MIIRAQMRGLSPFSYMTFYVETLEDLFCIAPSSVSQLIDPHLSFVPHWQSPWSLPHTVLGLESLPSWRTQFTERLSCLFPILSRQVYFTLLSLAQFIPVFILTFFLEIFPQESLPQPLSNHLFFLFLRFLLHHGVAGVTFHPSQDSPNLLYLSLLCKKPL